MKVFLVKILVLLLFVGFYVRANSQEGYFQLRGRIISQNKEKLGNVRYKVYENSKLTDSTRTSASGSFIIKLKLGYVYIIEFSKEAYTSKKIIVDTKVPDENNTGFFDRFNIIKLDAAGKGDTRSLAGLPVMKYFYKIGIADFTEEKITGKIVKDNNVSDNSRVKTLENELLLYQAIIEQQKIELGKINLQWQADVVIIGDANRKADSILASANRKAVRILEESKKDSMDRNQQMEKVISDISNDDFKDLAVNEEDFKKKEKVKKFERQIEELNKRQNKSATDSLNLKENKLGLRREFVDLSKAQLEIDRLNAKTHEDSVRIEQREAELFLIEQNMDLAAKEIETARKELELKDLELQRKNLILYGVIVGLVLLLILLSVIYIHYRDKKRLNIQLESKNDELEDSNERIILQNSQLEKQNIQIMKSINYGKRIQEAILPSNQLLKHFFSEFFVFFRPRDVVSGDFYWFTVQKDKLFVAAVDCTGHGVPGAFMSLIGNSLLNNIVNEKGIYKPSEILKELHIGVNKALSQSKSENDDRVDGMDMSLCQFDKSNKKIQLALANHTAFIINNGEVEEIEGDEISIADELIGDDIPEFTNHEIPMNKDASLYMFSDGFSDQFGGPKNKKFYVSNLKKLLVENQKMKAVDQYDILNKTFYDWKGDIRQYDDVLVMGFQLDS